MAAREVLAAVVVGGLVVLGALSPAYGTAIRFTYRGHASGNLDGVEFPDSALVITALGDTDDRESYEGGFRIPHLSADIRIDGLGEFDFVTPTHSFVYNAGGIAGFSRWTQEDLFYGPEKNEAFYTWDMLSSIGPITGTGRVLQWDKIFGKIETSGGVLFLANGEPETTYRAVVPAPGSALLIGIAAWGVRRRR